MWDEEEEGGGEEDEEEEEKKKKKWYRYSSDCLWLQIYTAWILSAIV